MNLRIIAGELGGRRFAGPGSHRTRPMSDKMRGALFNALGDLGGLSVLDAFAGSGALSFEAASRGAVHVMATEVDKTAQRTIARNIQELGLNSRVKLIQASSGAWLRTSDQRFDIILCDPPYDKPQPELLARLAQRVRPGGLIVFSLPPGMEAALPATFKQISRKDYGDSQLIFYRASEQP
jgi:16S rRNA (guanine966-N2)-methyltransferase